MFVSLLEADPHESISWLKEDDLVHLVDMPAHTVNVSGPKALLFFLLMFMKNRGDTVAAQTASRCLIQKIQETHRRPIGDPSFGARVSTVEALDMVRNLMDLNCSRIFLAEAMAARGIFDTNHRCHNLYGTINRLLHHFSTLQLPRFSERPVKKSVVRSMRVRSLLADAFTLAHKSQMGIPVRTIMKRLSELTDKPTYGALRMAISFSIEVMFARFKNYVTPVISNLSSYIAAIAMNLELPSGRGTDKCLIRLAKKMVTKDNTGTPCLDFFALADYVISLPPPNPRHSYELVPLYVSPACPPRDPDAVATTYMVGTRALSVSTKTRWGALMLDGAPMLDTMYETDTLDVGLEFAYGMPTVRMLAAKLQECLRNDTECSSIILSTAILWNMARSVRQNMTTEDAPAKKRKPSGVEPAKCMACMTTIAYSGGSCEHPMCMHCAASALEARVVDALAGDGSMAEMCPGNIGRCPQPGCDKDILWATPAMGEDVAFMLARVLRGKATDDKCQGAGATHVHCFQCWDAAEKQPDGVATCRTCAYQTCATCGLRSHPGDVCSVVMRGSGRTPEDILSEVKWQACPKCTVKTTKHKGCNHIVCSKCAVDWCWNCAKIINSTDDVTDHYESSPRCSLLVYSKTTETERMRTAIFARDDLSEEQKEAAVRMMFALNPQTSEDL